VNKFEIVEFYSQAQLQFLQSCLNYELGYGGFGGIAYLHFSNNVVVHPCAWGFVGWNIVDFNYGLKTYLFVWNDFGRGM
jgi:hypothetical protein